MYKNSIASKLLREPLLHFLLIGAGLFFLYSQLNSDEEINNAQQIVINKSQIIRLSTTFTEESGKNPTHEEIQKLLQDDIREEVLYREALALGLDKDDMIIRHRLAQKMKYLFEDITLDDELKNANEDFYENLKSSYTIIIANDVPKELNISNLIK